MSMIASMMLILYGISIMSMVLDFRLRDLPPKKQAAAILLAACGVVGNGIAMYLLGQASYGKFYIFLVQIPLYIGFYLFSRYKGVKLFFVLLSIIIFAAPPIMCVTTLRTFYQINMAVSLVVFFICYVLMALFVYKFLKQDFNYMLENCESRRFWLFCLIPMLNYVYSFAQTKYNFIQPFAQEGYWFRQIPTIVVFASYILLVRVFRTTRENQQLENEKNMMQMQLETSALYLSKLKSTQEQAVNYRHDLRHHIGLISGFLEQGEIEKTKDYLGQIQAEVASITPVRFCENETVNLVLSSFSGRAEKKGILLSIKADLPQELNIPDTELCSVFSNGLENALKAMTEVKDSALHGVRLESRVDGNRLLLLIENPYEGELLMENGVPISNCEGHGFGCRSMLAIAKKRKGFCTFKAKDGILTLRVVLPMQ